MSALRTNGPTRVTSRPGRRAWMRARRVPLALERPSSCRSRSRRPRPSWRFLVWRFGAGLGDALAGARPGWVAAAFVMATGGVLLGALRWQIVLEAMDYRLG